jgi:hypothetical protein
MPFVFASPPVDGSIPLVVILSKTLAGRITFCPAGLGCLEAAEISLEKIDLGNLSLMPFFVTPPSATV